MLGRISNAYLAMNVGDIDARRLSLLGPVVADVSPSPQDYGSGDVS